MRRAVHAALTDLYRDFGGLPPPQRRRYHLFAAAFFTLIGSHVASRPAKLAEFQELVGFAEEPSVRLWLPVFTFAVLIVYNTAESACPSPRAFVACVSVTYGVASVAVSMPALLVTWEALCPDARTVMAAASPPCAAPAAVDGFRRSVGWLLYLTFETRGILLPPMFWSVVSDVSSVETSRYTYVYIVFMGNLGGVAGSLVSMFHCRTGSLLIMQAVALLVFTCLMWPPLAPLQAEEQLQIELSSSQGGTDDAGVAGGTVARMSAIMVLRREAYKIASEGMHGLALIAGRPHVAGILTVSWAVILPRSVLDFQGNVELSRVFDDKHDKVAFLGKYNFLTSVVTCFAAAFGTTTLIKRLTPAVAILILPCVLALATVVCTADMTLVTINVVLLVVNLVERTVNTSAREMFYIRTSREIKYRAKSWGDVYGNSLLKMAASVFNIFVNVPSYDGLVSCPCMLALCAGWFCVALRVGRVNAALEATGEVAS